MKEKIIQYENLSFKLTITETQQLAFYFKVPSYLSEFKTDPLWQTFDPNDISAYEDEWSTSFEGLPTKVSVFKIKTFLIQEIVHFIHQNHLTWFWFNPSNDQRERIYYLFLNKFLSILSSKTEMTWTSQKVNTYFYFNAN